MLYQEEEPSKGEKPQLVPISYVSTTKMQKLTLEVRQTLAATLYCRSVATGLQLHCKDCNSCAMCSIARNTVFHSTAHMCAATQYHNRYNIYT